MVSVNAITKMSQAFDLCDKGQIDSFTLDDAVYLNLTTLIGGADTLARVPQPVADYYASRIMQFDVDNGGFPQAAHNLLDFFGAAARGYRALGLLEAAELIERAAMVAEEERAKFDANDIGDLFDQFANSALVTFDDDLDRVGWWADEARMAHMLRHRDAFLAVDDLA